MNRYTLLEYFTLQEAVKISLNSSNTEPWININKTSKSFYNILDTENLLATTGLQDGSEEKLIPYLEELFELVYARYYEHYAFSVTAEDNYASATLKKAVNKVFIKIVNIIKMTYDKYKSLLDIMRDENLDLLKKVGAISNGVVRFNDTPQNSGDFSSDSHTTNITESSTENGTDGATIIERIDEIKRKYSNLMHEWSNEFDKLFIEEGNI